MTFHVLRSNLRVIPLHLSIFRNGSSLLAQARCSNAFKCRRLAIREAICVCPRVRTTGRASPTVSKYLCFRRSLVVCREVSLNSTTLLFKDNVQMENSGRLITALCRKRFAFRCHGIRFRTLDTGSKTREFQDTYLIGKLKGRIHRRTIRKNGRHDVLFFVNNRFMLKRALIMATLCSYRLRSINEGFKDVARQVTLPCRCILRLGFHFIRDVLNLHNLILRARLVRFNGFLPFTRQIAILRMSIYRCANNLGARVHRNANNCFSITRRFVFGNHPLRSFRNRFVTFA